MSYTNLRRLHQFHVDDTVGTFSQVYLPLARAATTVTRPGVYLITAGEPVFLRIWDTGLNETAAGSMTASDSISLSDSTPLYIYLENSQKIQISTDNVASAVLLKAA